MNVWLLFEGERYRIDVSELGAPSAKVDRACPHCGAAEFLVSGTGKYPSQDDRAWEADAVSRCCDKPVGIIRAEVDTLFGVREDRAVLEGRCRVY